MAVPTTAKSSAELVSEGWEKRNTYNEPRLSELVDMYREVGYEVHLQPVNPDEEQGCSECLKVTPEQFKTIYTRKAPAGD